MKLIKEEVNQKNKYEKLFDEMLEYMEFRLVKYPDGTFGLIDLQGGNLGNIEDDRFDNALQLLDRLDIYYDDYFINPIADELKDKGIESFHKDFSIIKFRDELPDSEWDFDVLDMVINHPNDIDLNNCYREDDLIGESLKEAKENKIILNDAQKKKVLDYLYGEFDLYTFYKDKLDKEWYITDDKSLDPIKSDSDDEAFPMVLVIDGEFVDSLTRKFADEITSLKESVQLNEGTSNFWTQEDLPLYAFLTMDEAAGRVRERIYSDDEYDEDNEDSYYELEDKYYDELYKDGYVTIDLDDGGLEDAIDKFNDRTRELSYEAYDKGDDLNREWKRGIDTLSDEELDKIMEEANQWYDASDYLEGMKLKIKDGYYEGAQLYLDGWDKYAIAALPEEAKKDIVDRYNKIGKDFGLMKLGVSYAFSNGETGYHIIKESKKLTERRWDAVIKAGIELRNALSADKTDVERVREAIIACYDELYDKGLIDDYDHDEWTEEVRDCDFESEWGIDEDAIDYELDELYDLCDNIGAFLAITEADLDESLSQEIGQAYRELSRKYGVDMDALVSEFMKAKYPKGFPDFNGDVIYSEKHWDEFVDWCKQEKGVNLGESCKRRERKNKKALKESVNTLHIDDLNTGDTRILDAGQYYTLLELPDEAYWEDDWNKTKENNKRWDKWILECARPVIENALHEVSSDIKLVGELSYYHPAKYNFETDRIYFDVELPKETLDRLVEENIKKPEFLQFLKDHYTSRDGFWSHMANNSDGFMEQDDWKKLTSILAFNLSDSFDSRQRDFVEEVVYDWGDLEVHYDDDMNESLEGKDRKKFITLLTNELQKEPLAYSKDEANDIAIKRADALGKNPYDSIEALVKSEVSKTRSKKDESLKEDTVKQGNAWVNKGKEGTHGKFKTKKAADAQRKAMFANGYKESLKEDSITDIARKYYNLDNERSYDELVGLDISDAGKKLGYWWRLDRQDVRVGSDTHTYTFERPGVGTITLRTDNTGKVIKVLDGRYKPIKLGESLKESADDTKALIDFLKSLKLDDEVEEKVIGDWTVNAWTTEPRLNFSRGFYIVQVDNDKLNKHFSIPDCETQEELEYKRDRVINDRLGKSLKEAKENGLYDGKYYEYKDHSFILIYLDVTKEEIARGAKEEYAICCEDIVEDYDNAPAFVGTVDLDATDDDVMKVIADNYDALLDTVGKGRHIADEVDESLKESKTNQEKIEEIEEEKKETAKDRVLAKKAKLKESNCSEPEEKPEFLHKGDWVWDDVACDWYDNNSGDYHLELVHNSELPFGDSDEDIQAVFGLKESADWTSDEILAIVDKLNADGIATTTNKGIADAYAANENPYRRFEVSKADDKDEWTIKVVWKDDTFESDNIVDESLENIPTITNLFGDYDF